MRFTLNASGQNPKNTPDQPESLGDVTVKAKLNGENYPLWAKLMRKAIGGKGLTSHIIGVSEPPPINDPNYPRWEQRDKCVFNWIINNIEIDLVNKVSQYETARDLWEGLAITLHRQTRRNDFGGVVEQISGSMDFHRRPYLSTIDHPPSIEKDNRKTQRMRVYQFLTVLDGRFEAIKKEIINKDPLPTPREAYAMVRHEAGNERILKPIEHPGSGIGAGLAVFDRSRAAQPPPPASSKPPAMNRRGDEDKSRLVCNHCGGRNAYQGYLLSPPRLSGVVEGDEEKTAAKINKSRQRGKGIGGNRGPSLLHRRIGGWRRTPNCRE